MSNRYRKRPVEIEARQLTDTNAKSIAEWVNAAQTMDCSAEVRRLASAMGSETGAAVAIKTLEGVMVADVGDYVICGIKGEFYPCKPDIFEATYEAVTESAAG